MDLESLSRKQIDGSRLLEVANDLLVFRKFDEVVKVCRIGTSSKQQVLFPSSVNGTGDEHLADEIHRSDGNGLTHDFANNTSKNDLKRVYEESLCILAIQAYAELDQWQYVEPFLTHCYGTPAAYPVKVVQLCLLLYSKVHSYAIAEGVALQWLAYPNNQLQHTSTQYCSILELFVSQVLLPQGKVEEAYQLVERTECLRPETKLGFLKHLKEVKERLDAQTKEQDAEDTRSALMKFVDKIGQLVARFFPKAIYRQIQKLAVMGLILYLILFKTNLDLSSSISHAAVLWSGVARIWYSLFAPFHLMPKS